MPDRLCSRCGKPLQAGGDGDACCPGHPPRTLHLGQQPLVFAGVLVITAALWTVTHFLTRAYIAHQDHLAQEWYERGEADMQAGRLDRAVAGFRTALAYSRDNFAYRLRLAEALVAARQWRQAEAQLRALWDEEPGNGAVNLQLARLAAAAGEFQGAVRYYHGAIYGSWQENPAEQRRNAHLELAKFLLQHNAKQQAESELIALAADLPRDPAWRVRVAGLFEAAGEYDRALREYQDALALAPRNPAALAGAGETAFRLQRYVEANDHLRRAVAANPQDTQSAALLQTTELVLELDPFVRRLSAEERSHRVLRGMEQAQYRLEQCASKSGLTLSATPPQSPLQSDYSQLLVLRARANAAMLRRHSELANSAMDLVFRAERDAAQQCGSPLGADYALLLIARMNEGAER